jgi:lysophospholipase L1-like esterase
VNHGVDQVLDWVALGDSYTIGTSVSEAERWPNQLVDRLAAGSGRDLSLRANLAVNGYTTGDVVATQLAALGDLHPGFVSLLVGVNDVVRGVPADRYERNVIVILDRLLEALEPIRIVTVSTPDYTVTPQGPRYGNPSQRSAGIRQNNAILQRLAAERSIACVDIFDISLAAATDPSLVASDGLHPSGRQYGLWVDRIAPVVEALLGPVNRG